MAKLKARYVCQACGSVHSRWQGQCPDCAEWNTLTQEAATVTVFSAKHDLHTGGRAVELVGLDAAVALPERVPSESRHVGIVADVPAGAVQAATRNPMLPAELSGVFDERAATR